MLQCHLTIEQALPLMCICSILSFLCGVGIGGNDLSANFAMVVGSGSLNMKQAIVYCVVFELLGAFFMGGHVSNMIRNGIIDTTLFHMSPDMVIAGMTCATFSSAMWLYLSTVFGLPVSITHTVVGSVLGFGIFSVGSFQYVKMDGLQLIVASWLVAPIFSAIATAALFWIVRRYVLHAKLKRSFTLASRALPYCMFVSLMIDVGFIFIEQPPLLQRTLNKVLPTYASFTILTTITAIACYAAKCFILPETIAEAKSMKTFCWEAEVITTQVKGDLPLEKEQDVAHDAPLTDVTSIAVDDGDLSSCGSTAVQRAHVHRARMSSMSAMDSKLERQDTQEIVVRPIPRVASILRKAQEGNRENEQRELISSSKRRVSYGTTTAFDQRSGTNVLSPLYSTSKEATFEDEDESAGDALAALMPTIEYGGTIKVRHFNPQSEYLFTVLQVLAGAMSSFVHGAVAGANATATFVILYDTFARHYLTDAIENDSLDGDASSSPLSVRWAMLPAMLGISIGMISLGARLMKTVGMDLVTVTPARGWCMQVGGTLITMICTGIGIPVSLSQCQIGAAIGCGVTDAGGTLSGVSWRVVLKIMAGWIFTLLIGSLTTGLTMRVLAHVYCGMQFYPHITDAPVSAAHK
ncbi:phosphate transporter, putative [Bodo saltans]|uniref:Phosphate transporter n=1 Tax=Bodo saltans TaxID=75058 RepID=A0A0S4JEW4_BODSA|nr:phosphate transporter, putative [Bodo saltans]|eukprot:CUG88656.1 phosphate transporter, putative [Bodo saltans]